MSTEKKLTLQSSDGEVFVIKESIAARSATLKHMIENDCASNTIPLPNVDGKTLAMVIEYCHKHADLESGEATEDLIKSYDSEFVDKDQSALFDLIMAANYLDIKELMDVLCQKVADMIKDMTPEEIRRMLRDMTPEEIRRMFNIVNDFTPKEEENVRKENAWAFE